LYHRNGVDIHDRETRKVTAWLEVAKSREEEVSGAPPIFLEIPTVVQEEISVMPPRQAVSYVMTASVGVSSSVTADILLPGMESATRERSTSPSRQSRAHSYCPPR